MTGTVNPSTTTTTILRPLTTMRVATEVSGTTTSVETTTTTTPTTVLDRTTPAVPTDSDTPTATWAPLEVSSSANTAVKTSVTMAQLASADTTVDSLMLTTALALWARATATSLKRVATVNSTFATTTMIWLRTTALLSVRLVTSLNLAPQDSNLATMAALSAKVSTLDAKASAAMAATAMATTAHTTATANSAATADMALKADAAAMVSANLVSQSATAKSRPKKKTGEQIMHFDHYVH